jgi:hypothetical protein
MTKARDLANGATALSAVSATELAYLDGVTSAVQTQIDGKQAVNAAVSTTELGYLDGVTSAIQTQLDAKIPKTLTTTTGDIIYASAANTPARLGIGSTSQVLTVSSGVPSWATPAGSSGPSFGVYGSAAQTGISNATFTKVALNTELWDTDSCYDTSTYRFTPNKAGYYQINANIQTVMSPVDLAVVTIYKNGAEYTRVHRRDGVVNSSACSATLVYLNGTTDYIEFFAYIASTTTRNIELDSGAATTGVWIRS